MRSVFHRPRCSQGDHRLLRERWQPVGVAGRPAGEPNWVAIRNSFCRSFLHSSRFLMFGGSFLYHTSHRSPGARTIGESFLQPNASAKAGMFDNGPITRYFAIG
jgi:hypothetical protein